MLRVFLDIVIPLATPVALYALWAHIDARRKGKGMPNWEEGHWFWVILLGGCLSIATVVWFGSHGENAKGEYVPAHVENGQVVPGEFK